MVTVTLNLSDTSLENLNEVYKLSKVSNKTTAVATALNLTRTILEEIEKGNKIIIRSNDGDKELKFK